MRYTILKFLLIALIPVAAFGQESDDQVRDSSTTRFPRPDFVTRTTVPVDWLKIERHFEVDHSGFNVVCDIIAPPQPLTPGRAVITVTSVSESEASREYDFEFFISYLRPQVELLSEGSHIWSGPRDPGDMFTIEVEFLARESGTNYFALGYRPPGRGMLTDVLHIEWCLDELGELILLRNGSGRTYHPVKTVFFGPDSVNISRDCRPNPRERLFNTRMTITPPLQIGDTSTIRYHLTAHDPIPGGIHYNFEAYHMDVVSLPDRLVNNSIGVGETVVFEIKVVPRAVRDPHFVKLAYSCESVSGRGRSGKSLRCWSVFNEDGSLRFVYPLPWKNLEDSHYPRSFPEAADDGRWKSRWFRDTHQPSPRDLEGVWLDRREKK